MFVRRPLSWMPLTVLRGAALAAMLGTAAVQAQPMGIPSMGAASSADLSPALERTLGDAIMEQGRRDPTYINDPDVNQYLTALGRKLVATAPGAHQPITVFAIRDPQINAFALPGGYIGIHSGLVASSKNESELASVIAHEIGHVLQRHVARGMTQQSQNSHIMIASVAGALLAALAGSGDLAMGVAAFGQAAAVDRQLGFSRQAEQEADRTGFDMLRKAGFDPNGMVEMFNQLSNASRLNEGAGGGSYASTHPLSIQRMSDIENRVRETPKVHHRDSDAYWYVRAKLRVLQARDSRAQRATLQSFKQEVADASGVAQSAAWYGQAYAAWLNKDFSGAQSALENAGKSGIIAPELSSLGVLLALDQGRPEPAYEQASKAWSRWPQNQGVALAMVEAMQKSGRYKEAVPFLTQRIEQWPDEPRFNQLLAQSHEKLGQPVQARRAMADYYVKVGALPTAVEQLTQARSMSKDFYVQSELDVQIRTIKQKLKADRELLERFKS